MSKMFMNVKEVMEVLEVSESYAYKLMKRLNRELQAMGCFLQALFGKSCKVFLENVASPNWRKLQSLGWQLSCQPHSHCRPYLVVTV